MNKFISINVEIYNCHVIVTWEHDIQKIIKYSEDHGCKLMSEEWKKNFLDNREEVTGLCMELGEKNTDVLVWLKEKPKKLSTFATLYHELYHAVDNISQSHNISPYKEIEARAYLFEFLFKKCN